MICNGAQVNDPQSPYNGTTLPDLHKKFTRGIDPALSATLGPGSLPDQQGQDSFALNLGHSHFVNGHQHGLPSHTHNVSGVTKTPNISMSTVPVTGVTHLDFGHDNHTHNIDLPTGGPSYASGAALTESGGAGQTGGALGTNAVPTVPAYVGLLKIIRIK